MSARGVKNTYAAVGGSDGSDHKDRAVLHSRYDAMVYYRGKLQFLFILSPMVFFTAFILSVVHATAAGLKVAAQQFLPPFPLLVGLLLVCGVVSAATIRLPTSGPLRIVGALSTIAVVYLTLVYSFELAKHAPKSNHFIWFGLGALVNALAVLVNTLALYYGYMFSVLQGSVGGKKKY